MKKTGLACLVLLSLVGCDAYKIELSMDNLNKNTPIDKEEAAKALSRAQAKFSTINIKSVRQSPIDSLYEIWTGDNVFYVDKDFNYRIHGEAIGVDDKVNYTDLSLSIIGAQNTIEDIYKRKGSISNDLERYKYREADFFDDKKLSKKLIKHSSIAKYAIQEASSEQESPSDNSVTQLKSTSAKEIKKVTEDQDNTVEKASTAKVVDSGLRAALKNRIKERSSLDLTISNKPIDRAKGNVNVNKVEDHGGFIEYNGTELQKVGYDKSGRKVGEEQTMSQVRNIFSKIKERGDTWTIKYPAIGEEKKSIAVFTDPGCPYCANLHKSIPELNKAGVTVHYLFYPRLMPLGTSDPRVRDVLSTMKNVWCSDEPGESMSRAFHRMSVPSSSCEVNDEDKTKSEFPAYEHYTLGQVFGIDSTPLTITDDGRQIYGFRNAKNFLYKLDVPE